MYSIFFFGGLVFVCLPFDSLALTAKIFYERVPKPLTSEGSSSKRAGLPGVILGAPASTSQQTPVFPRVPRKP
jgi:hypothetical protein